MPDQVDVAGAESDAATAEMGAAFDRLLDRLLLLGDRHAGELAAMALQAVERVLTTQAALSDVAIETLQGIHDKELQLLGSDRQDAARRLLEASRRS